MPFKAAEAFEQLSYDFRPYVKEHGVTPEPSDEQIRQMIFKLQEATSSKLGKDFDPTDQQAAMKVMSSLTNEQLAEIDEETMEAIAIVTEQLPSLEVLKQLPARVKRFYFASLLADLVPQPTPTGGTNA